MKLGKTPPGAANEDLPEWAKQSPWVIARPKFWIELSVRKYDESGKVVVMMRRSNQPPQKAVASRNFEPYAVEAESIKSKRVRAGLASGEIRQQIPNLSRQLADEFCEAHGIERTERGVSRIVQRLLQERHGILRAIGQIRRDLLSKRA